MSIKGFIEGILVFVGGMVFGAAVIFLILSFATVVEAQELTLEEQMEIHTQYLAATDEALDELNHCAAWISLIPYMIEAIGNEDPRARKAFQRRVVLLGNAVGIVVFNAEYYFPHIYGIDTNFEKIKRFSAEWVVEINNHPPRYVELAETWFEKCELMAFKTKTYFSNWLLKYPAIVEDWPFYPGRGKPPEDWVSPSMKRIKEMEEHQ